LIATVKVLPQVRLHHHETRGYRNSIPQPLMETLGNPDKITFVVKPKREVEVLASKAETTEKENESHQSACIEALTTEIDKSRVRIICQ
jgi:hypothetical protein